MVTRQEAKESSKLAKFAKVAMGQAGRMSQLMLGTIKEQGPTVIPLRLAGKEWLCTLSKPVGKHYEKVKGSVQSSGSLGEFLRIAEHLEKQFAVRVGLVPHESPLFGPIKRRHRLLLKRAGA